MVSPVAQVKLQQLGTHWPREVASVLLPGTVLIVELLTLTRPDLVGVIGRTKLSAVATTTAAVSALAAAIIVGYTSRLLVFWALRKKWKPPYEQDYGPESLRHMRGLWTEDVIERGLADSPIRAPGTALSLQRGYWLYCKNWLRTNAPLLGIDDFETEVNLSWAFIPPVLLGGPAMVGAVSAVSGRPAGTAAYAASVLVALVFTTALAFQGKHKQIDEANAGLERYVMARLMWADSRTPAGPPAGTGPSEPDNE